MGRASRSNPRSLENIRNKPRTLTIDNPFEKRVKVHIPNSQLDIVDALFVGMLRGLKPMTPEEHAEAVMQGMDMRPPDIRERERKFGLVEEKPESKIILTDKE